MLDFREVTLNCLQQYPIFRHVPKLYFCLFEVRFFEVMAVVSQVLLALPGNLPVLCPHRSHVHVSFAQIDIQIDQGFDHLLIDLLFFAVTMDHFLYFCAVDKLAFECLCLVLYDLTFEH